MGNGNTFTFDIPTNAVNISANATVSVETTQGTTITTTMSRTEPFSTGDGISGILIPSSITNSPIVNINAEASISDYENGLYYSETCMSKDFDASYADSTFEAYKDT